MKINKSEEFFKLLTISLSVLAVILFIVIIAIYMNSDDYSNNMKMENNNTNPVVVFETNMGNIELELFLKESPVTAGNFKNLVEEGFYDGTKFHRVIKDFMIQGGDPLSKNDSLKNRWGTGGSEPIQDEFIRGLSNVRGTIAMANAGPNSGSSQFFINTVNNTGLDWDKAPLTSKHPVFGKVVSGMDVVDKIGNIRTGSRDIPVDAVIIRKAYLK